jgi:uncharacterized glyoxalase superfamily protein PhnB
MHKWLLFLLPWALGAAAIDSTPYPTTPSPKGLQVQIAEDALALGIHHAAINVNLPALLTATHAPSQPTRTVNGFTFNINQAYVESLDRSIQALSDHGVVVKLILITYRTRDPYLQRVTTHPNASATEGAVMAANTVTPEGRACYQALTELMAERWSSNNTPHGRVWGWIISNEVNSHHQWHQMGPATAEQVATQYEDQVRLAWTSLRQYSQNARVYLSMEQHWTKRSHADALKSCEGRTLLELFAARARERGDFDWNLAFHPYPANLGDARTWLDPVTFNDDTPKVTFKNIEVLVQKLAQPALLYQGHPRQLAFTEQGFHCTAKPDGETIQAAAYAYAWEKIRHLHSPIDAFIYHRQVDHAQEGGLNLGLWSHKPGNIVTPDKKRPIWYLMQSAETPQWDELAKPYLSTCGLKSWDDINVH